MTINITIKRDDAANGQDILVNNGGAETRLTDKNDDVTIAVHDMSDISITEVDSLAGSGDPGTNSPGGPGSGPP